MNSDDKPKRKFKPLPRPPKKKHKKRKNKYRAQRRRAYQGISAAEYRRRSKAHMDKKPKDHVCKCGIPRGKYEWCNDCKTWPKKKSIAVEAEKGG